MIGTDDDDLDIDLELYCCKFYDKNIHVKHTYFLIIPTDKDNTTIHINYDLDAQPNNETVKTVFPYQAKTPSKDCGQCGQRKVKTSAIHHYSRTSIMTRSNRKKTAKE